MLLMALIFTITVQTVQAQVTIGSGLEPTRAVLLDLKTRQAQAVVNTVGDDENISS
jgi:hypothetical protein